MPEETVEDPTLQHNFKGHKGVVHACAFKPNLKQVWHLSLSLSLSLSHLISISIPLPLPLSPVSDSPCVWDRLYRKLVTASEDHSLMIWSPGVPNARAYKFSGHTDAVTAVAYSSDGTTIASGSRDRSIRMWTPSIVGLYEPKALKSAHGGCIRSVSFSRDGTLLVSAADDKTVKIWGAPEGKFLHTLSGHINWVRCAEFNHDNGLIVSASDDKTARLWDVRGQRCAFIYDDFKAPVRCAKFHPDGAAIATAGDDRTIQVWDIRSQKLVQHYHAAHGDRVNSLSFHPSGDFLLSTSDDGTVKVWDLREGQLFYTLNGHDGPSTCAEFSPDGSFFASGGADQSVMVWKTNFDAVLKKHAGATDVKLPAPFTAEAPILKDDPRAAPVMSTERAMEGLKAGSTPPLKENKNKEPVKTPVKKPAAAGGDGAIPEALAQTLGHIVGQLDVLTKSIGLIEERLSANEDRVKDLVGIAEKKSSSARIAK